MAANPAIDREISSRDIQQLSGADSVAAFFATLGYDVNTRIQQTPAAMGITADALRRKVRRIERIADQEYGSLQLYLVEMDSVTQAAANGLARALRDRTGNYLLVLTEDYEELRFVLVDRELPPAATTLASPTVVVRPRILSVRRRTPDPVAVRVLRRFSYTESDAEAQFDKLRSAYTLAEWSEPNFNNRALFADYYLNVRLRDLPEWADDPRPAYLQMKELYASARERLAGAGEPPARTELIERALQILGFIPSPAQKDQGCPDYLLNIDGIPEPVAGCLAYGWDRYLDGKDELRDALRPTENPGARVVSVLEAGSAPWAIVTNGRLWRLYAADAHSRATNYYEVDLEEILSHPDPAEPFRYFWLLFRAASFRPAPVDLDGETRPMPFVERLLRESDSYAHRLGERLKERVFEEVFPELAMGFIACLRRREGPAADLSQTRLDGVFLGTLTLLYRLLFLLYAESRDLLPTRQTGGYWEKSLSRLKREVAEAGGPIEDEARGALARRYSDEPSSTALYDSVMELCRIVDRGDPAVNVPVYNGGLFLTEPDPEDTAPEAEAARFLLANRIPDLHLARALDRLARDPDEKRGDLVQIDYKSLGVRQLGSIYEGLLEFRLRIAPEKMAVVKGKKTEEIVPYREALEKKLAILTYGRGRNATARTLPAGTVFLENDRRERKATGSYYTPDHIVKYIVREAVGPVLKEHLEKLRPRLREAQKAYHDAERRRDGFLKSGMAPNNPENVANEEPWRSIAEQLFDFRVLDPAMGSGHFLVEAVDFVTDRMLDFLNGFPWNPVQARLRQTREAILGEMERQGVSVDSGRLIDVGLLKRHVLKRCVYGVDLNPMAVELAKLSLWLDCFTLGAPLSFLDHHLKFGNSLIGTTVQEVEAALAAREQGHFGDLFGGPFQGLLSSTATILELAGSPDATMEQTRHSHSLYHDFEREQAPYRAALDIWVSRHFGNALAEEYLTLVGQEYIEEIRSGGARLSPQYREVISRAATLKKERRFFHWDLEFPEAFIDLRANNWKPVEQQGFDAVIGNPPYDVLASEELGRDLSEDLSYFSNTPGYTPSMQGARNLYKLFICRALWLTDKHGAFSFIVPMSLLGDEQAAGLRQALVLESKLLAIEAFPQKDDPRLRVFAEAKLSTAVFVCKVGAGNDPFTIRSHPGSSLSEKCTTLVVTPQELVRFDPTGILIPSCSQRDWAIASEVSGSSISRLGDIARCFRGDLEQTAQMRAGTLGTEIHGPLVLRGANITLYAAREASQGEDLHIDVQLFLKRSGPNSKAFMNHGVRKIGYQRSAPQNNFRRLIAAPIPDESFCLDTVSYVTEPSSRIDLDLLLVLLNSRLLDWYFRIGSTNSKVNEYQFNSLPVPATVSGQKVSWRPFVENAKWDQAVEALQSVCTQPGTMPQVVADALAEMSRRIQAIESRRVLKSRSERSHLAAESQPIQDAIDAILFRCYGLSEEEGEYITHRLGEML